MNDQVGVGVFATAFIPAGTVVYVEDPLDIVIPPDSPLLDNPVLRPTIDKYAILEPGERRIIGWDAAKYVNHCCQANIISTGYGFEIALRDIQPDEIDDRFHVRRLYDERFVIGVGPGHTFDKQNAVRVQDLHDQPYVNRLQCEFFGHAGHIFREHGGKPRIVFRSDRDDWVQSMAMAGLGFTFIPEFAVTMPGLKVRPLIEPEIVRTIQVVTVRGRPHTPAVGAFVREILAFPWVNASA